VTVSGRSGGAAKPLLQFSHANGFPGGSYRVLFEALRQDFRVKAVERFGHDPRFPVTDGWPRLVDELIEAVETHGEPVLAVGHSLGGYLSLMAAARRPDLFRGVILLDAPVLGRFQGSAVALVKRLGLVDRVTLAGITRERRREWPDRAAAAAHFARKRLFQRFDPRCLDDYLDAGTEPSGQGVRLRFDPDVEAAIYATLPHHMARWLRRLAVPGALVAGADSDIVRRIGLRTSARRLQLVMVPGGHHFPFQQPALTARVIAETARVLGIE
jgi:pimeloyl-ACP methyl ester carboxylesterase